MPTYVELKAHQVTTGIQSEFSDLGRNEWKNCSFKEFH